MNDFFLIAEIRSTFGTDGFLIIDSFSDFKDRFFDLKKVFVEIFGTKKEFRIESVKEVEKKLLFKFSGFNSSDDVALLIGKKIFVEDRDSIKPGKDTYFIHDLIGSEVFKCNCIIGKVEDVLVLPSNDVYVVRDTDNRTFSVPAVKDFIKSFDADKKILELVSDCDLLYDDEN